MGCKPTYKGVQYDSIEALKAKLSKEYEEISVVDAVYNKEKSAYKLEKTVYEKALLASTSIIKSLDFVHETSGGRSYIDSIKRRYLYYNKNKKWTNDLENKAKSLLRYSLLKENVFLNIDTKGVKNLLGLGKNSSNFQEKSLSNQITILKENKDVKNYLSENPAHPLNRLIPTPKTVLGETMHLFRYENTFDQLSTNVSSKLFEDMFFGNVPFNYDQKLNSELSIKDAFKGIARSLIRYNYYTSGLSYKSNSFVNLFSEKVLSSDDVGIVGSISEAVNRIESNDIISSNPYRDFAMYYYNTDGVASYRGEKYTGKENIGDYYYLKNKTTKEVSLYERDSESNSYNPIPVKVIPGVLQTPIDQESVFDSQNPVQESRISFGLAEDIDTTQSKINSLTDTFKKEGVEVQVVEDDSIEGNAEIQNVDGKAVIRVKRVFSDTIYHEFGHLYIDLLGTGNPLVSKAIEQLRGTELYKEVSENYPNLSGEMLDKEVLSTAIGREGAKIFNDSRNQNKFITSLNKIFRAIGKLFGITPNASKQLARQMIEGDIQTDFNGSLSKHIQRQKQVKKQKNLDIWFKEEAIKIEKNKLNFLGKKDYIHKLQNLIDTYQNEETKISLETTKEHMQDELISISNRINAITQMGPEERDEKAESISDTLYYASQWLGQFEDSILNLPQATDTNKNINDLIGDLESFMVGNNNVPGIHSLNSEVRRIREGEFKRVLSTYTTNPSIINSAFDIFSQGHDKYFDSGDESSTQLLFDALADTNNSFVALWMKKYMIDLEENRKKANELKIRWVNIQEEAEEAGVNIDEFSDKKSGRFISKYNDFEFEESRSEMYSKASKMEDTPKRTEFISKWYRENQVPLEDHRKISTEKAYQAGLNSSFFTAWREHNKVAKESNSDQFTMDVNGEPRGYYTNKDVTSTHIPPELRGMIIGFGKKTQVYKVWYWDNHSPKAKTTEQDPDNIKMSPKDFPKGELVRPSDKYLNKDYEYMMEEGGKKKELFLEITEMVKDLSSHDSSIQADGYLPAVPKDKRSIKQILKDSFGGFSVQTEEEPTVNQNASGEEIRYIPFAYSKLLGEDNLEELKVIPENADGEEIRKINLENQRIEISNWDKRRERKLQHAKDLDYNLKETMPLFIDSAMNSKFKKAQETNVLLAEQTIQELKLTKAKNGKGVVDKQAKNLGVEKLAEIEGKSSNLLKHFKSWKTSVFYEDFKHGDSNKTLRKAADALQDYSSMLGLGFNVFSGLNNKVYGETMIAIESVGNQFFSTKDWLKSKIEYDKDSLILFARRNEIKSVNITEAIIKYFDILQSQDELSGKAGGYATSQLHKFAFLKNSLYAMQHAGEHSMQNQVLLAMLRKKKVLLNGKEVSLRDAFEIVDGQLEIKKGVTSLDGSKFDSKDLSAFKVKAIGVNQYLHGIYNKMDAGTIQKYALGRLGMQFRKWARPSWNKRFGTKFWGSFWNERREMLDEGYYKTASKFAWSLVKDIGNLQKNSSKEWNNLDETQKANVKRALAEAVFLSAVILAGKLLQAGLDDDDDIDKVTAFMLWQTDRLYTEIALYQPLGWWKESKKIFANPFASLRIADSYHKIFKHVITFDFLDEEKANYRGGQYYGENKLKIWMTSLIPVATQWQRWDHMEKTTKFYKMY